MLIAGIRASHDFSFPGRAIKPEGFVKLDSEIRQSIRAVAEITATTEHIAGMAGIKVTW